MKKDYGLWDFFIDQAKGLASLLITLFFLRLGNILIPLVTGITPGGGSDGVDLFLILVDYAGAILGAAGYLAFGVGGLWKSLNIPRRDEKNDHKSREKALGRTRPKGQLEKGSTQPVKISVRKTSAAGAARRRKRPKRR